VTNSSSDGDQYAATLVARQLIRASPEVLFAAWSEPQQLAQWWGPEGVECTDAAIDLRVGGAYRIANRLPDGAILIICGVFDIVQPPNRLRFSWQLENQPSNPEQVTVTFEPRGASTEVTVVHERISSAAIRESHKRGWSGCLAGLARYVISRQLASL
jgi:uncharacterized protein YndB with AHSA1/START domain